MFSLVKIQRKKLGSRIRSQINNVSKNKCLNPEVVLYYLGVISLQVFLSRSAVLLPTPT